MRSLRFMPLLMLAAFSFFPAGAFAQMRTSYGYNDPYYNGSPYIPVPASVLYGCHSSDCTLYQGQQPTTYVYPQRQTYVQRTYPAYDDGAQKGITYVQPSTSNYSTTNVYPAYATTYPGTPNTGIGDAGFFNLWILGISVLMAMGAGFYLLRSHRHA